MSSLKENYNDEYAVCPFFVAGSQVSVTCEGICEGGNLRVMFANVNLTIDHRMAFCESIKGFEKCPIYELIARRYEEK